MHVGWFQRLAVRPNRIGDDGQQARPVGAVQVREQLAAHAWLPKLAQVLGDFFRSLGPVGIGLKKLADAIGHVDQNLNVHVLQRVEAQ